MHTGDTVTDSLGRNWTVGASLGRGLWGSTWLLRGEDDSERVLKVAHARTDFPRDARLPDGLERACAQCVDEQASLLRKATHPFLPRLEDRILVTGRPALILPRYRGTLAQRLADGASLGNIARLLATVADHAQALQVAGEVHGNLRPSNILLKEDGQPVLSDALTPTAQAWRQRLQLLSGNRSVHLPREAAELPTVGWDTFAICACLYHAATWQPGTGEPRRMGELITPTEGLDKVEMASLRDRCLRRLKAEDANPRFASQVAERIASLLNRGLSREVEPSPPYRFNRPEDLRERIAEAASLIHPHVESVGKVLFPSNAPDGVYVHTEPVAFTVTVAVTDGVGGHEQVAAGLRLLDLDAPDRRRVRVSDASFDVKPHPSGRLRYHFSLRDLPPGRYELEVAFSIQDSGDAPKPARAEVVVRPSAGYVPPVEEAAHQPGALSLPTREEREQQREDPIALDARRIPTPIAPTASLDLDHTSPTAVPPTGVRGPDSLSLDGYATEPGPPPRPVTARPGIAITPPTPRLDPSAPSAATPSPTAFGERSPTATVAAPPTVPGDHVAPSAPSWEAPGEWEELPDPSTPDYVPAPDEVEDLPAWQAEDVDQRPPWARVLTIVRNDTFAQLSIVTVAVVMGLLVIMTLLSTCGS